MNKLTAKLNLSLNSRSVTFLLESLRGFLHTLVYIGLFTQPTRKNSPISVLSVVIKQNTQPSISIWKINYTLTHQKNTYCRIKCGIWFLQVLYKHAVYNVSIPMDDATRSKGIETLSYIVRTIRDASYLSRRKSFRLV